MNTGVSQPLPRVCYYETHRPHAVVGMSLPCLNAQGSTAQILPEHHFTGTMGAAANAGRFTPSMDEVVTWFVDCLIQKPAKVLFPGLRNITEEITTICRGRDVLGASEVDWLGITPTGHIIMACCLPMADTAACQKAVRDATQFYLDLAALSREQLEKLLLRAAGVKIRQDGLFFLSGAAQIGIEPGEFYGGFIHFLKSCRTLIVAASDYRPSDAAGILECVNERCDTSVISLELLRFEWSRLNSGGAAFSLTAIASSHQGNFY